MFTGSTTPQVAVGDAATVTGTVAEYYPDSPTNSVYQSTTELTGLQWTIASHGNPLPAATVLTAVAVPDSTPATTGRTGVLKIESLIPFAQRPFPVVNTGDALTGVTSGPVEYDQYGSYTLQASVLGDVKDGGIQKEVTRKQRPNELAVATYNVENLSSVDSQEKFDQLARGIVDNLASPDIVTLEEIQDNNGADGLGDGVVAADQTLQKFTDAIVAVGGPRYEWREIDPQDLTDGGETGGNIRVGFLINPGRVSFVDRPGGDATTAVSVVTDHNQKHLSISPGRIDPTNAAWQNSRKPLAGEFVFRGKTVFVIANHFNSKGGDQPTHGRFQPPTRSSEVQRGEQAQVLRGFVDQLLQADPGANVIVAGDLNDYQFSSALETLTRRHADRPHRHAARRRAVQPRLRGKLAGPGQHSRLGRGARRGLRRGAHQRRVRDPGQRPRPATGPAAAEAVTDIPGTPVTRPSQGRSSNDCTWQVACTLV